MRLPKNFREALLPIAGAYLKPRLKMAQFLRILQDRDLGYSRQYVKKSLVAERPSGYVFVIAENTESQLHPCLNLAALGTVDARIEAKMVLPLWILQMNDSGDLLQNELQKSAITKVP